MRGTPAASAISTIPWTRRGCAPSIVHDATGNRVAVLRGADGRALLEAALATGRTCVALDDSGASHGYPSLTALSGPILRSADFPDLTPIYRKLGVNMVNGEPTLDESASLAHVRRAIFTSP